MAGAKFASDAAQLEQRLRKQGPIGAPLLLLPSRGQAHANSANSSESWTRNDRQDFPDIPRGIEEKPEQGTIRTNLWRLYDLELIGRRSR